jgi:hypothetical protein
VRQPPYAKQDPLGTAGTVASLVLFLFGTGLSLYGITDISTEPGTFSLFMGSCLMFISACHIIKWVMSK